MLPLVAIIGRPNVGKSALFNRLIGKRHAIVSDVYGTTRDIISGTIVLKKREIELVDTAGIMSSFDGTDPLIVPVQKQAQEALQNADLILFLVDGMTPLTKDDSALAHRLRKSDKPVLFIVTKCDNPRIEYNQDEIYKLGLKNPIFVSALHNRGISDLLDRIHKELKRTGFFTREHEQIKKSITQISFSIVGKPNVGKSSLFNQLVKKSKAVVSDIPGTTRDTLDSEIHYGDMVFKAIDTAGLKRPGKIEKGIEKYSTLRTMRAISRSDICLFVIDANEKISRMDQAVSRYILDEKKGIIIVVNKWDLMEDQRLHIKKKREDSLKAKSQKLKAGPDVMDRFLTYMQNTFDYLPWAPVLFVSAKTGKNISSILDQVYHIYEERKRRIETGKLNRFVDEVTHKQPPSGTKKISPKIFYATQVDINPPHFILFVNMADAFHFSWRRFFENQLREKFGFTGTPLVIEYRNRTREERGKRKNKK